MKLDGDGTFTKRGISFNVSIRLVLYVTRVVGRWQKALDERNLLTLFVRCTQALIERFVSPLALMISDRLSYANTHIQWGIRMEICISIGKNSGIPIFRGFRVVTSGILLIKV